MCLIFSSCQTTQLNKSGMMKINHLDEAANFLMVLADDEMSLSKVCQISSSEALTLIQPLHAMIDEEIKNGNFIVSDSLIDNCEFNCHCGIYSDLTENKLLKDRLLQKAQSLKKSASLGCAQKTAQWFCTSNLLKDLKTQSSSIDQGNHNTP